MGFHCKIKWIEWVEDSRRSNIGAAAIGAYKALRVSLAADTAGKVKGRYSIVSGHSKL